MSEARLITGDGSDGHLLTDEELYGPAVVEVAELTDDEIEAIVESQRNTIAYLEIYANARRAMSEEGDRENLRAVATRAVTEQATHSRADFMAVGNILADSTDNEDVTEDDLAKEKILKDALDEPMAIREITPEGTYRSPDPELRKKTERVLQRLSYNKSEAGERQISTDRENVITVAKGALTHSISMYNLHLSRGENEEAKNYLQGIYESRRRIDLAAGTSESNEQQVQYFEKQIENLRTKNPDIADDDPKLLSLQHEHQRAQEALMSVRLALEKQANNDPRKKLGNILSEHPEAIVVVDEFYGRHNEHVVSKDLMGAYLKKKQSVEKAKEALEKAEAGSDPAELAFAQIKLEQARADLLKTEKHREVDLRNAKMFQEVAESLNPENVVRKEFEAEFGTLDDLAKNTHNALLTWKFNTSKDGAEYESFAAIKKLEHCMKTLDERMADIDPRDPRWGPLRFLRQEVLDIYLGAQYMKVQVRTEEFANTDDFNGRYAFSHLHQSATDIRNKGVVVYHAANEDGEATKAFVVYPDRSYASIHGSTVGPRKNAYGETLTDPPLQYAENPRDIVRPELLAHWDSLTLDQLKDEETRYYGRWFTDPSDIALRSHLEVVSEMLITRIATEAAARAPEEGPHPDSGYAMEALYTSLYLASGRTEHIGLRQDGAVMTHDTTIYGITGDWIIRPNGAAEIRGATFNGITGDWLVRANGDKSLYAAPADSPEYEFSEVHPVAFYPAESASADDEEDEPEDGEGGDDSGSGSGSDGSGGGPIPPAAPPTPPPAPTPPVSPTPPTPPRASASSTTRPHPGMMPSRPATRPVPGVGERTASAAPSAPTPPPTPEDDSLTSGKPMSPIELRRLRREALQQAVRESAGRTVIGTAIKEGESLSSFKRRKGEVFPIGNGEIAFGDGATRAVDYRVDNLPWDEYESRLNNISPENVFIEPETVVTGSGTTRDGDIELVEQPVEVPNAEGRMEPAMRFQYRFDPRIDTREVPSGSDRYLAVDALLPRSVADKFWIAAQRDPRLAREFAHDLFVANSENGEELWNQGYKPPYESLPFNWEVSFVQRTSAQNGELIVTNKPAR